MVTTKVHSHFISRLVIHYRGEQLTSFKLLKTHHNLLLPLKWNTSLTAGMYTSVTAQTDNQTDLASQIYTIGSILATDFNEKLFTLVGSRQVLTSDGETYFRGAINGLQSMAPALFAIQQNTLDLSSTAWTTSSTWTNYLTRFNGTWVGTAMTATGNQFGMSGNMAMGLIFIVPACMIFLIISAKRFNTTDPGLVCMQLLFWKWGLSWDGYQLRSSPQLFN